jgi:hypothetical protein
MTPLQSILLAIIAAIPPTLAALASLVVALKNSVKADAIHKVVNGNAEVEKQKAFTAGVRVGAASGVEAAENRRHSDS